MTQTSFQASEGYTKIINSTLRAIYRAPFNATEIRVILAIVRMTRGWNKENKIISYSYLAKEVDLDKRNVRRAVSLLVRSKVIIKSKAGRKNILGLNQNYVTWELWKNHSTRRVGTPPYRGLTYP
jgi:phage replication O-like protein O